MKSLLLLTFALFFATASASEPNSCFGCDELEALEKKVAIEINTSAPQTEPLDVEAIKIINKMGKLSPEQAAKVVSYLKLTLPTDPSRSMIEAVWPTISKNKNEIVKAAKSLSKKESDIVILAIENHESLLKFGNDPK